MQHEILCPIPKCFLPRIGYGRMISDNLATFVVPHASILQVLLRKHDFCIIRIICREVPNRTFVTRNAKKSGNTVVVLL